MPNSSSIRALLYHRRAYAGEAAGLLLGFGGERLEFRRVWLEKREDT